MSYDVYNDFEDALGEYTGAPYVVLTDCCTHAIELCMRYKQVGYTMCPTHTYISVPMMLYKCNIGFEWSDEPWYYEYELSDGIWDSARALDRNMYRKGQMQCLSFGHSKRLDLKRGGAILLDNMQDYVALKKMGYDGRDLDISPWELQQQFTLGFHYKMDMETAKAGHIKLWANELASKSSQMVNYPNVSKLKFDIPSKYKYNITQ